MFSAFASAQAVQSLQGLANHTRPTKNLRASPPRLRSRIIAEQQAFLRCSAAQAKIRKGVAKDCCRQTAARTSGYTLPHICYFTMTLRPFVNGDSYGPRSIRPMTRGLPARSVGTVIPFALPTPTHGEPLKSV